MTKLSLEDHFSQNLKDLHYAITKNYHDEEALFTEYLAIGNKLFDLETGIISKIDKGEYRILSLSSPLEGLEKGQLFKLEDTYCREVVAAGSTIAFAHIGVHSSMSLHPVYINMKLESYISAPIFVNEKIFGTINFTDRAVRGEGFSSNQFEMIEIMAQTIGRFLESQMYKEGLNRLTAVMAHDIKNPIGSIISLSELIELESKEESIKGYNKLINQASNNCFEMVDSILNMSAIESGKVKIVREEVDVKALVQASWAMVDYMGEKKEINLVMVGESATFPLDKQKIIQSLTNLFSNAIKFSERNSSIIARWFIEDDILSIEVEDSGIGMSARQIEKAFDNRASVSTPGTEGERGTGYGLPVLSTIILFHSGKIDIESEVGRGTIFKISMPRV